MLSQREFTSTLTDFHIPECFSVPNNDQNTFRSILNTPTTWAEPSSSEKEIIHRQEIGKDVRSSCRNWVRTGILYGHHHRAHLSDPTFIPPSLWKYHPDKELRGFYGVLNNKTRKYSERAAGRKEIPVNETLKILTEFGNNLNDDK